MTTAPDLWRGLRRPLVAILRGVQPDEVLEIAAALTDAGFEAIEVPLNSPDPFSSIERLVAAYGDSCLIGAGTVLRFEDVDRLGETGARLCVSPNCDPVPIRRAVQHEMVSLPGVFTATEALAACNAGARALKFFPASVLGPSGIKAIQAVLPAGMDVAAVGGVGDKDFAAYAKAGIRAFGLGSSIYAPGATAEEVAAKARQTIAAWDACNA